MAISKVIYISSDEATPEVWMDVTQKTVTSGTMLNGTTALKNDGTDITGNIASKSSSDLTASGATVTASAGYYPSNASKSVNSMTLPTSAASSATSGYTSKATISRSTSDQYINIPTGYNSSGAYYKVNAVANGSATTPSTSITANPSISVGSNGLITASVSASKSVAPTVSAGYVSSGTAGTVSVSGSNTSQLTTQAAQTIYPSTSDQTISSGKYLTGTQTIKGVLVSNTLTAANIASGVTVKIGDSADDDRIMSVTGTHSCGGGSTPAPEKDVNFIDYDGTILYSYTAAEAQALTALPANPSHTGLTAQGWNWTLAQIKSQLTNVGGKVWVGQMYVTQSGATEIDVEFPDAARLNPTLTIAVNGTTTVDWGDNTTPDTVTGSSLTTRKSVSHSYASAGSYMISISAVTGSYSFYGSGSYFLLRKNATANENKVYSNCVKAIRIGDDIQTIGDYAFYICYSLASITIPSSVTTIRDYAFHSCYSLASITIPSSVTTIRDYAFSACYSLASVTIPSNVTIIRGYAFNNCLSLASITIPSGVTSIGADAFYGCCSLASITIPSSVTSIGGYAFYNCYGTAKYQFKSTTPPTLGTTAFAGIVSDCVIYVPYSADHSVLEAYQTASYWSTYASYMQEEPQ